MKRIIIRRYKKRVLQLFLVLSIGLFSCNSPETGAQEEELMQEDEMMHDEEMHDEMMDEEETMDRDELMHHEEVVQDSILNVHDSMPHIEDQP